MAFDAGAAVGKINLDTSSWEAGVGKVNSGQKMMSKGAKMAGAAFVAAGALIVGAIVKSVKAADEWQKSFSNVSTLVDTASVDMQGMAKELFALDTRLGSAKELTDGLYQALSASVDPAKAVEFVGTAAEFAKAALIDTNTAVDVITTGLNAYGLEADEATGISDKLFSVIKLGKTTGSELAAVLGQSIPLAANMGISFDELGASVAIMTRQGVKASEATTQFNGVLNSFLKPSDDMKLALQEMGFESGEMALETLGVKGTLDELIDSTGGSKEALAGLFQNTRALRGVMALTGEGAADFDNVLSQIQNSAGATTEAFNKQEITFDTLKNTMGNMSVIVGNIGKSFADELAVGATEAANSMIQFLLSGQGAELVGNIIAGVSAAFKTFKEIAKPIVDALLPTLKSLWDEIAEAANTLGGDTGDAAGAFNVFGYAGQVAASVIRIVGKQITLLIKNVVNLVDAIKKSGGIVGKFFEFITGKAKWDDVKNQISAAGDAFAKFGVDLWEGAGELFQDVFTEADTFKERMAGTAGNIKVAWTTEFERTKDNVIDNYGKMVTGQDKMVDKIINGAQTAADALGQMSKGTTDNEAEEISKRTILQIGYTDAVGGMHEVMWERVKEAQALSIQSQKDELRLLQEEYQKTADMYISAFMPVLAEVGAALVDEEKGWDDIKEAGKRAIAGVVEAFAQQWAVQAAAAWAAVAGGAVWMTGAAWGYTGASAAAYTAAGAIRALRTGGMTSGLTLVGEEGPEFIAPPPGSRVFSNSQTNQMIQGGAVTINNYVRDDTDIQRINRRVGQTISASMRSTK